MHYASHNPNTLQALLKVTLGPVHIIPSLKKVPIQASLFNRNLMPNQLK